MIPRNMVATRPAIPRSVSSGMGGDVYHELAATAIINESMPSLVGYDDGCTPHRCSNQA